LKRVPLTSDGNCFYTAFLESAMMETDIQKLRKNALSSNPLIARYARFIIFSMDGIMSYTGVLLSLE
jgi:hypothetical protein